MTMGFPQVAVPSIIRWDTDHSHTTWYTAEQTFKNALLATLSSMFTSASSSRPQSPARTYSRSATTFDISISVGRSTAKWTHTAGCNTCIVKNPPAERQWQIELSSSHLWLRLQNATVSYTLQKNTTTNSFNWSKVVRLFIKLKLFLVSASIRGLHSIPKDQNVKATKSLVC